MNIMVTGCGPLTGLKEIIEVTQFTFEGTIMLAESRLTDEEDEVYTEYEIHVIRVFRNPTAATRSTPGPTDQSSPFVTGPLLTRPSASTEQRVRLRRRYHGRVVLDGGVVTATAGGPTLTVGQHVIVSAYFDEAKGWWAPFGFFEVQNGRVLHLDNRLQTKHYDSVEEFAAAVANPPPTAVALNER